VIWAAFALVPEAGRHR